jgi:membrane protease YdiL (CAAX protease family)
MKRWWVKALLTSVLWAALAIGALIVHTEVVLKGKLTEKQDEAISEKYGMICGAGLGAIWGLGYLLRRRKAD